MIAARRATPGSCAASHASTAVAPSRAAHGPDGAARGVNRQSNGWELERAAHTALSVYHLKCPPMTVGRSGSVSTWRASRQNGVACE